MEKKEEHLRQELGELTERLSDTAIYAAKEYPRLAKRRQELESVVALFDAHYDLAKQKASAQGLSGSDDQEMATLAKTELEELEEQIATNDAALEEALTPKDPNDEKDAIIEIRAAAGGDEASLFAGDLYRMYSRYAERQRWHVEVLDSNQSDLGGFKEIVFEVKGRGAYSRLKYESGVPGIQRVPN